LILNRIGDFGFIFAFLLIFYYFKTVDFAVVFALTPLFSTAGLVLFGVKLSCLDIICTFLFLGSIGKSAQLGLHTWLPDAMEGPTPVSALIHAATLVTAGIFLIVRCSPIFEYATTALFIVSLIGGASSFFAATIALTQNDIKRVIAYSTASQLGYMVFICGLSAYNISMFHLINHAFFKALLFLSAGSVIHAASGDQDLRRYGSLCKLLPYTYSMMLIGSFALAGIPFMSGFYSKDLILETAFSTYKISSAFVYWLGTMSAVLTAFYSFRALLQVFHFQSAASYKYYIQNMHEPSGIMCFALAFLAFGSIFSGFFFKDAFVGLGTIF
jgi:proton-translocating NADH-quinone oxidoreductase chain L